MEIRLKDIIDSREELKRLFSGRARAKETFNLALIRRKINPYIEAFDEARLELFKAEGHRDLTQPNSWNFWIIETGPDGKETREFDHAAFDRCDEQIEELLDERIEIDFSVDIATIDKAKIDPPLTPDEMEKMWWVINEFHDQKDD